MEDATAEPDPAAPLVPLMVTKADAQRIMDLLDANGDTHTFLRRKASEAEYEASRQPTT